MCLHHSYSFFFGLKWNEFASPSSESEIPKGCASCNCFLRILMRFILYSFIYSRVVHQLNFHLFFSLPVKRYSLSLSLAVSQTKYQWICMHISMLWANIYPTICLRCVRITGNGREKKKAKRKIKKNEHEFNIASHIFQSKAHDILAKKNGS